MCDGGKRYGAAVEPVLEKPPMPVSGPVEAVGTLGKSRRGYVLNTDGGGHWDLGHVSGVQRLVGCRVRVEGSRCGFNAIACRRLWAEGEPRPRYAMVNTEAIAVGFMVTVGLLAGFAVLLG